MNKKNTIKNKKINQNIEAYLSRFVVTKKTKLRKKIKFNLKNKLKIKSGCRGEDLNKIICSSSQMDGIKIFST